MSDFKKRKPDIKLTYKIADGINLPLWVFFPDKDVKTSDVVLLIHGGGWYGAVKDNSPWDGGWLRSSACKLAELGYVSIIISYRSLRISDSLNVSDLYEDCCDAVRFIRNHLKFIDMDNYTCIGESAGGYLSTMLGISVDDTLRPKKVVSLNPVLGALDTTWKYGFNGVSDISLLSPFDNVHDKASDFLFMHGTGDEIVDIKYTRLFNKLLNDCGHKSILKEIQGAKHAFALYDYISDDDFVNNIMDSVVEFIKK